MNRWTRVLWPALIVLVLPILRSPASAQTFADTADALQRSAARLFLDCRSCDNDYIRTELTFVNYVRDPVQADIHVLVTDQGTAGGGREYTLTFIGRRAFAGINDTLTFVSKTSDTDDTIRGGIVLVLKQGLLRYALHTPLREHLSVHYDRSTQVSTVRDPWDFWVFSVGLNSFLNAEEQTSSTSLYGKVSANRITQEWKVNLSLNANYSDSRYDVDTVTTVRNVQRSQYLNGLVVRSISDHWSAGISGAVEVSSYNNVDLLWQVAPTVEYDIFPYSESTRQQLRLTYFLAYNNVRYVEETIFDRTAEQYLSQSLAMALELKQTWGTISTTLRGTQYPWDFRNGDKPFWQQVTWSVYGMVSWRIVEGLSFNLFGNYSAIHDQFSLTKAGASRDDILLQRTRLATNYSYYASIGLSYSFGAIYNNIVNPRMGNSGGSSFSISF